MSLQDPLSDMIVRIKNAQARMHVAVSMPSSKLKENVAQVLQEEGFIKNYNLDVIDKKAVLKIDLKYFEGKPAIYEIKRSSKPSLRLYSGKDNLPSISGGLGVAIISTSKGVMTDHKARIAGVGGEVLCTVF